MHCGPGAISHPQFPELLVVRSKKSKVRPPGLDDAVRDKKVAVGFEGVVGSCAR